MTQRAARRLRGPLSFSENSSATRGRFQLRTSFRHTSLWQIPFWMTGMLLARPARGQPLHAADSSSVVATNAHATVGAMGTATLTRVSPAYNARTFTEAQLVQPVLMTSLGWHALAFTGTLDGEGYTLRRGELTPGIFGEGYVDRRHPHTFVHEAMFAWQSPKLSTFRSRIRTDFSLAAGKGFVPFGSDDPMMRPFEKYPVNHHHAQIIERVQAVAAARVAGHNQFAAIEFATFNGDEPAGPFHGPQWSRIGDSWATRVTLQLAPGVQLAGSRAWVTSPEIQQGGAFDHAQHHVSLRIDRPNSRNDARYLLAEWARTDEIINSRTAFRYKSSLMEGAYGWHGAQGALRVELTDRAEQLRLLDPFRAPAGHIDFQILGVTQWQVTTLALQAPSLSARRGRAHIQGTPFVEIARAFPSPRNRPTVFEPSAFYGRPAIWSLTMGLRVRAGAMRSRMGNYGVMGEALQAKMARHVM
jgi:hypothetical protein